MSEEPNIQERLLSVLTDQMLADGEPGMVTGFVFAAEYVDAETGKTGTWLVTGQDQPSHRSLGLIHYAREFVEAVLRGSICGDDDDDE